MDISSIWNTIIIEPMVNTLLGIYSVLTSIFGPENMFGLAIIIFTILIRLITYPLTYQQMKSGQAMQDLQKSKEWQTIQKKYKDNKEKLAQEQMKIYKEKGVSPFSSCLPTIIQFPIIIGLYQSIIRALAVTPTQLLGLSFNIYPFIPAAAIIPLNQHFLWMNLSEPERLNVMGVAIPVLSIIVVITTFLQSKLMAPVTAQPGDQGASMTKAMNLYMPLLMGWLAYSFSAGLALYFITSNLIGILQYGAMGRLDWRNIIPSRKTDSKVK